MNSFVSFVIAFYGLIHYTNGCSILQPKDLDYYINSLQLLDEQTYPDQLLVTIHRYYDSKPAQGVFTGPFCRLMNITNNGSLDVSVPCDKHTDDIREWSLADTDEQEATAVCRDNCDGSTATCEITTNSGSFSISDLPYNDSSVGNCSQEDPTTSFSIPDASTLYISFPSNTFAILIDYSTSPISYEIYGVTREGDGWSNVIPGFEWQGYVDVYSSVGMIKVGLPCCLCYGHTFLTYTIESNNQTKTQIVTIESIGTWGGQIDTVQARVVSLDVGYPTGMDVYDIDSETMQRFELKLCADVSCLMAPCESSTCEGAPDDAVCYADYCTGCDARWFCGDTEITSSCGTGADKLANMCSTGSPTFSPTMSSNMNATMLNTTDSDITSTQESENGCNMYSIAFSFAMVAVSLVSF